MSLEAAVVVAVAVVGFAVVAEEDPEGFAVVAEEEDPEEDPEHSPLEMRFLIQGRKPWTRA